MKAPEPSTPTSHDALLGRLPATLPLQRRTMIATGKSTWVTRRTIMDRVIDRYPRVASNLPHGPPPKWRLLGPGEPRCFFVRCLPVHSVVPAHGVVEGAGGVLHLGRRFYGFLVVRDNYPLGFDVHLYVVRGDGMAAHDDVLQDVADGVVDSVLDAADLGAGGVEDGVALQGGKRVVPSVVRFLHGSPSAGGVVYMRV